MASGPYSFGEYRLDPARRELWRGDDLVRLPAKVFDCIAYLAEHRERAIGRDELIAAVWGRADVTDNLLDQVMLRARRALGDVNGERHVIRTIPRFGFSWVAQIEAAAGEAESAAEPSVPSEPPSDADETARAETPPRPRRRLAGAALAAVALVAAAAWFGFGSRPGPKPASVQPAAHAALVLPVAVRSDDESSWIRLGVMDFIAARLRAAGLAVAPSDSAAVLSARDAVQAEGRAEAVAQAIDASLVVEPQAETVAAGWRVQLRARRANGADVASEAEGRSVLDAARAAADRLALALGGTPPADARRETSADELLQQATAALLANRFDEARALLDSAGADSATRAQTDYLKGRVELVSGHYGRARAIFTALAERVSETDDPVLRGRALYGIAFTHFREQDSETAARFFDMAVAALERAGGSEAAAALGRVLTLRGANRHLLLDAEAAQRDFARARVLLESSGDLIGLVALDNNAGQFAVDRNRFVEAVPLLERAVRRALAANDLDSELRARIGLVRARLGQLDPAAALAQDADLRRLAATIADPALRRHAAAHRAEALFANGRFDAADAALRAVAAERVVDHATAVEARLAFERGAYADAAAAAAAFTERAWDEGDPRDRGLGLLVLLRSRERLGQDGRAVAAAARDWASRLDLPEVALYAALVEAEQAAGAGDPAAANVAYARVWQLAQREAVPFDLLQAAESYTDWAIRQGDPGKASVVAERVAGWADRDFGAALVQLRLYRTLGQPVAWATALDQARRLAGERRIPDALSTPPAAK